MVFTHPNLFQVTNVQNLLSMANIQTIIRHEFQSAGAGELSPQDTWPELWLVDDRDLIIAHARIKSLAEAGERLAWFCGQCGEKNDGAFEFCWQCQAESKNANV